MNYSTNIQNKLKNLDINEQYLLISKGVVSEYSQITLKQRWNNFSHITLFHLV
jgi:hypothetical protein